MATSVGSTNLTTANTWQLLEAINPDPSQSSTMAVYTNGTLVASGTSQSGTTVVTSPLYINGQAGTSTNSYASYLAEVVVFNTGLSLANRQLIEGYLAWKWGLQASLPNTHPYYSATPSAGVTSVGSMTVDTIGNIEVIPTNTFRVLGPTEWRTNMITVSGTSLTIATPTLSLPATQSAALYTITNTGFNALVLPTYTSASPGVFWTLANATASNLTIGITYTSGSGLGSSITLAPGSSVNIYWNGTSFTSTNGQGPISGATGPTNILTANGSNAAIGQTGMTFSSASNIVTVGGATAGSTTSGSVNVAGGYFVNGVQLSGGSAISTYSNAGAVIFATGTSTGLQGSSNLFFNTTSNFLGIQTTTPATALDVNGGVTIRNGFRPIYSNVSSGTSLTVSANSYGTHFNITASTLTGITLPTITWSTDSNAYWVFRNNTGTYLSITFTYTGSYTSAPTNPVTIPPANSTTIMMTYPGGTTSNYVLF